MGRKRKQKNREFIEQEPPDQKILDLIGSPNPWTPEIEDTWLGELGKISAKEIYSMFPPIKKPSNVALRGKSSGA